MYYKLDVDLVLMNASVDGDGAESIDALFRGQPMADQETTYRFLLDPELDEDTGEPVEPYMYAYYPSAAIMEERLIQALQDAGVDNLQLFPAVIEDQNRGKEYSNYKAVNIIGVVSCADLSASVSVPMADVHYFHTLVIDPNRVGDFLCFRLAEQQTVVIVHDSIAAVIEAGEFPGVELTPIDETKP